MTTVIEIDWREWRNWDEADPAGAIAKLNQLLEPHGVALEKLSRPGDDFIELRAFSLKHP